MTPEAEKFNGWAAMLGFVAAVVHTATGQIIPASFNEKISYSIKLCLTSLCWHWAQAHLQPLLYNDNKTKQSKEKRLLLKN